MGHPVQVRIRDGIISLHMVPEEDVVPLVVEGDAPLPPELGIIVEDGGQHAAHRVPQPRGEVVEDDLGPVLGDLAPVLLHLSEENASW